MHPIALILIAALPLSPVVTMAQDAPLPAIEPEPQIAVPQVATPEQLAEGEADFRRCTACHGIGEGAANRMGPQLNGIMGEPAATRDGYSYSQTLMQLRDAGLVWTPETLGQFLSDPRGFAPGNKMAFAGVKDEADLASIIVYLASFSPDWQPPAAAGKEPEKNPAPAGN